MPLTLTPETEARLRAVASVRGLAPEDTLDVIIADAEVDDRQMQAELQASVDAIAAGHSLTLEEYRARAMARRH